MRVMQSERNQVVAFISFEMTCLEDEDEEKKTFSI